MQKFLVVETIIKPAVKDSNRVVAISRDKYNDLVRHGITESSVRCASKGVAKMYAL